MGGIRRGGALEGAQRGSMMRLGILFAWWALQQMETPANDATIYGVWLMVEVDDRG